MKVTEVINSVMDLKPSAYDEKQLMVWLNQLEAMAQKEAFGFMFDDIVKYDWAKDGEAELVIYAPYDSAYFHYICAQIDFANQEAAGYSANMEFANSEYAGFRADVKRNNRETGSVSLKNYY